MTEARGAGGGLTGRMAAASVLLALLIGGSFLLLLLSIRDIRNAERRSARSQQVLVAANELERLLLDLETGQRGFVLTGQEQFLEPWQQARRAFPHRAATLLALVAGDPTMRAKAREIARRERAYIEDYAVPLVNEARRGDPAARSVAATLAGKRRIDVMREDFDQMLSAEQQTAGRLKARVDSAADSASLAAAGGLGGSLILISLYAAYLTRAIVRPVRRAAVMAGRLAGGDLGARMPETGAGEIGGLERSFNVMAGSLERNQVELAALAHEQAALRRVATLVARGASPPEVFTAVASELAQQLGAHLTRVIHFEPDDTVTVVGGGSAGGMEIPIGARRTLKGEGVAVKVKRTGQPARTERFEGPPGSLPDSFRRAGAQCGVGSPIVVEGVLWGAAIAAFTHDEPLAADSEERITGFTELAATAIANAAAQAELTASRARIVATADETRQRIERDLHDGAQQRLVSLVLQLRSAQAGVPPELVELRAELDRVAAGLVRAQDELREYARGIHPAILAEGGLRSALRTLARRSTVPVELDVRAERRLPERIEVGAYYVVSEALANAAKHANASRVAVEVEAADGALRVSVRDDGDGGADFTRGSGLVGLKDRVEALGGRISVESARGEGTAIAVELPLP
jgi:signal transduction histidine kinase/CHASE3 domain sensor protein